MSEFICGKVLCPFFKDVKSQKQKIICEGVEDGSITIIDFSKKANMNKYINRLCCNEYSECLIAQALYEKYKSRER